MVIRLTLILMSLAGAAQAENLPDPTRPPGGVDAATPLAAVPRGPTLQVIRTLEGKRIAIISGQAVSVGGKVGDATVIRIDEDRVLLRGADGVQTLKLFPDVEKSPTVSDQIESKPPTKVSRERVKRKEQK